MNVYFTLLNLKIVHFLECFITSCDYRVRYVHHGAEEDAVESSEEDGASSGFRLWSSGPNFDTDLPQDVTGVVGHTAYLTCRVFDRTNSTVSSNNHDYVTVDLLGKGIIPILLYGFNDSPLVLSTNAQVWTGHTFIRV